MTAVPGINPQHLLVVTGGDESFIESLIALFKETTVPLWEELRMAVLEENTLRISQIAHKIKPSLLTMGMESMLDDIILLEGSLKSGMEFKEQQFLFQLLDPVFLKNVELLEGLRKEQ